jgi:probable rRNA maturation factor
LVILQRKIAGLSKQTLDRFVLRARLAAGLRGPVNVLLTSSAAVRSLNRRFRNQDKATDVLSFPSAQPSGNGEQRNGKFTKNRIAPAGDIAISAEIAARNASPLKHSAADEVKILILHGMLHLAGFDHERDNGEMARREMKLRKALRLPVALIERAQAPVRDSAKRTGQTGRIRPTAGMRGRA